MVQVDEKVTVAVTQNGQPIGFIWRNDSYVVTEKPERWFTRKPWWNEASRVNKGAGQSALEVEIWRLLAIDAAAKKKTQYEFIHCPDDNTWRMVRIY